MVVGRSQSESLQPSFEHLERLDSVVHAVPEPLPLRGGERTHRLGPVVRGNVKRFDIVGIIEILVTPGHGWYVRKEVIPRKPLPHVAFVGGLTVREK